MREKLYLCIRFCKMNLAKHNKNQFFRLTNQKQKTHEKDFHISRCRDGKFGNER